MDIENGLSDFPFQELIGIVQEGFLIKSFTEKEKAIYLTVLPKYCLSIGVIVKGGRADTLQRYFILSKFPVVTPAGVSDTVKSNKLGRAPPEASAL